MVNECFPYRIEDLMLAVVLDPYTAELTLGLLAYQNIVVELEFPNHCSKDLSTEWNLVMFRL